MKNLGEDIVMGNFKIAVYHFDDEVKSFAPTEEIYFDTYDNAKLSFDTWFDDSPDYKYNRWYGEGNWGIEESIYNNVKYFYIDGSPTDFISLVEIKKE